MSASRRCRKLLVGRRRRFGRGSKASNGGGDGRRYGRSEFILDGVDL